MRVRVRVPFLFHIASTCARCSGDIAVRVRVRVRVRARARVRVRVRVRVRRVTSGVGSRPTPRR